MTNNAKARKIVIIGNSSSGKSTLAKALSQQIDALHLDLDTLAWKSGSATPERRTIGESMAEIEAQLLGHKRWVVEGCYADLAEQVAEHSSGLIYMDLSIAECIENARSRPWEPHKYPSKAEQDANLPMLLDWIAGYESRTDSLSAKQHRALYQKFSGEKKHITSRIQINDLLSNLNN